MAGAGVHCFFLLPSLSLDPGRDIHADPRAARARSPTHRAIRIHGQVRRGKQHLDAHGVDKEAPRNAVDVVPRAGRGADEERGENDGEREDEGDAG